MSTNSLNLFAQPEPRKHRPRSVTRASLANMNVIEQMVRAFSPGHRLSGLMGVVFGGFVPIAVYALVHAEVNTRPWLWIMVAGGAYSAISVYKWAEQAFHIGI